MDKLNQDVIKNLINPFYKTVKVVQTTASTNDDLKELASTLNSPYVLISNHQSKGRGRNKKSFYSPANTGIYMSIFIKPDLVLDDALKISACISVAVADAIKELYQLNPQIKWINDIYLNDKKIAGILCESSLKPNSNYLDYMIIGVGINVHKTDFNDDLKELACSIENNSDLFVERNELISLILNNFYNLYLNIEDNTFLKAYKDYSYILNQAITVYTPKSIYNAWAIDFDNQARLIVKKDNEIIALSSGEVTVRKIM